MNDAELRAHLIKDAYISKEALRDALNDDYVSDILFNLKEKFEVFSYATENGHCEVIEWRGYYFSGSEWDELSGPHLTLDSALDPIRYLLECGDEVDTESATHIVDSKWPDKQTFEVIRRIVSVDDTVELNGVKYRRTKTGYVVA
jgi:Flp pilus assembly CpaF family ATPase